MSNPRTLLETYLARRYSPVPIPPGRKAPTFEGWQNYEADGADLSAFDRMNVGLLLGEKSGGLVDVDLDCPEALAAAPHLLPETAMVSGRAGAPRSHRWYKSAGAKPATFADPARAGDDDRGMLAELRAGRLQTVVPPSTHKGTGEPVVWHQLEEPAEVGHADLLKSVARVAAASLLARHWPGKGRRQDAYLALAGGLARSGWSVEEAERFVHAIADAAGDDEARMRVNTVARTFAKVQTDDKATGWKTLAELVDAKAVELARAWLGCQPPLKPHFGGSGAIPPGPQAPRPWPLPTPLHSSPAVPEFPVQCLTPWMRDWAVAVSAELQTPLALGASLALAVAAGGLARKVAVTPWPGWEREPVNLYVMCLLRSGERKSAAFRKALEPARRLEARALEAAEPLVAAAQSEHRVATKRVDALENKLAKCDDPAEKAQLLESLGAAREELLRVKVPAAPVWVVDDDTPEMLASELCRQGGRLMAASAEAKALENIVRDDRANVDIFLKAHAGDDHRTGRADRVALTLCYTPQPSVLQSLAERPELRERGFLGRWLYWLPESKVGERSTDPTPAVPAAVSEAYSGAMTLLWSFLPADPDEPVVLTMDAESVAVLSNFAAWVEPQMRPGEPLAATAGWANKLAGLAVRLAGVLHCTDLAARGLPPGGTVGAGVTRRAVTIVRDAAAPHALAAFDLMGTSEFVVGARLVLRWLGGRDQPLSPFTKREAHRACRGRFKTVDELQPVLDLLERHDLIRVEVAPAEKSGPGRRPSPNYEVNPAAFDAPGDEPPDRMDTNDRNTPPAPPSPNCVHSVRGGVSTESPPEPGAGSGPGDSVHCVHSVRGGISPSGAPDPVIEPAGAPDTSVVNRSAVAYTVVRGPDGLTGAMEAVRLSEVVGLDTETTGLDSRRDRLRLVSLATVEGVFLVDCFAVDPSPLWPALASSEVAGHNLAFDLQFLARLGYAHGGAPERRGHLFDSMLASQLLEAGDRNARHGLKDVAKRHLNLDVDKTSQKADWSGPLSEVMLDYAAADAELPVKLQAAMRPKVRAAELDAALALEMGALPCAAWASGAGVAFDRGAWEALAGATTADATRLRAELDAMIPGAADLYGNACRNWDSPIQVKAAFESVGVTLDSADDDALATVAHPAAAVLRDYRGASKLVGTYGASWLKHAGPGGRVYCRWRQLGTMTGRMSGAEPNLQQLPRDARYRRCFAAPPGRVLVKADYSQIELRIAAKVANDKAMQDAYRRGDDLHALTARMVLGKAEVTKADRQTAKAVNFGLLFGAGARTLAAYAKSSYGVAMTVEEADKYRRAFFRAYPGLRRWHDRAGATGDNPIETRTAPYQRRRSDVSSFTEKLNSPVQGAAADGLKAALGLLWETRHECPSAVPVLFVHDEVVIEVDEREAEAAKAWLVRCMVDGMAPVCRPVPVEVEAVVTKSWGGD